MKGVIPACKYCQQTYCLTHLQPEMHGCGDAVRNEKRVEGRVEYGKARGEAKEAARADLKKKLEAKQADLAKQRAKKQ
jgi:hypothetical protein